MAATGALLLALLPLAHGAVVKTRHPSIQVQSPRMIAQC